MSISLKIKLLSNGKITWKISLSLLSRNESHCHLLITIPLNSLLSEKAAKILYFEIYFGKRGILPYIRSFTHISSPTEKWRRCHSEWVSPDENYTVLCTLIRKMRRREGMSYHTIAFISQHRKCRDGSNSCKFIMSLRTKG